VKARLLHCDRDFDWTGPLPPNADDLTADLELGTMLGAMAAGDKFVREMSARVLLTSLTDPDSIGYRQRILADCIAHPDIIRQIYGIATGALDDKRRTWGYLGSQNPTTILSAAVGQLDILIARLRQLRQLADEHARLFKSDGLTTFFTTVQQNLDDEYFDSLARYFRQLRFDGGELLSARLGRDGSGADYVLRSGSTRRSWRERIGIGPQTVYSFTISPRDEAGADALADIANRGVNLVANAAAQSADHVTSYFTMLRAELAFYIGCLNLHGQLTTRGLPLAFPEFTTTDARDLSCSDLRDACLALHADHVIGNDVDADGTELLVITGANSGGKSTFLRSVGLAQLMTQCGLFVTAAAFRASICAGVFTHFIRDEDPALVSGRLDDELARMSIIADQIRPGCLMLFNESFASTNEREGSEIGRQVVTALLEAGIRVCLVTHQYALADSFRGTSRQVLFLRAPRQPGGHRDFKLIAAEPLPTSYGTDIYHRIGGWLS
jgi:hypothetical protein